MHLFFYAEEDDSMKKRLVAYFSAGGTTKKVAEMIANCANADLIEITPKTPYTERDLNWMDKKSRSTVEMKDKSSRPELADTDADIASYDKIFVGFPIWWYTAPTIINTFLEQYDLTGKTIIPFATSGSSGMGDTNAYLKPSCPGAILKEGKRFPAGVSVSDLKKWAESVR